MILTAKELEEIGNDMDLNCIEFAKYCLKNIKKSNRKNFYVYKKQNKVVADEFMLVEILHIYKEEKFKQLAKK